MALLPLPDGSAIKVRPDETEEQAWVRAQQMYPEAFGIEKQRGFMPAMKAGFNQGMGAGLRGIGDWTGSTRLDEAGKAMMAPDQTPGAFQNTTGEDTDAAFKEGIIPGVSSFINQHVTEPIGGMFGRYGVPMAVGAAAVPAAALAGAPVAAGSLGALALGGAGFMAADTPMEQGENKQRFEEVQAQRVEQGLAPQQYDALETTAWSLAQASLMPLLGAAGGKLATPFLKAMGPELATTAKMVQNGQLTKEAAIAQLNSHGRNYLVKTAEMGAIGVPLMVGTEAMRTAQSGEDWTGEPATDRYGEAAKAAIVGAPVFGALGFHGVRRGQMKLIDKADEMRDEQVAKEAESARKQAAMGEGAGEQLDLDMTFHKQPRGGRKAYEETAPDADSVNRMRYESQVASYTGAHPPHESWFTEVNRLKPAEREVVEADPTLTRAFFNKYQIPNRGKVAEAVRSYEGVSMYDTEKLGELHDTLRALGESRGQKADKFTAAADEIRAHLDNLRDTPKRQADWVTEQAQNDNVSRLQAGEAKAANQRQIDANTEAARVQNEAQKAESIKQTATENALVNNRTQTRQEDMFNHALTRDDMSKPEPEVVASPRELADRKAEAYEEFEAAYEEYKKTGDDTALTEIVARAKEELGPYDEHLNQQSTRALFDKNGRPTPGARNAKSIEPTAAEESDRASDAVPVSREAEVGAGAIGVDTAAAETSKPADARPAVGEERVNAPVEKNTSVATKVKRVTPMREEARSKKTWADQLVATESQKKAAAEARAAKGAEQYLPEATTTGIGRAGKATVVEEFTPVRYKLDSPEHMSKDGTPNKGMQALWWNDLAQMAHDIKNGTKEEKLVAREAIKQGRKNKTITTEQLEHAIAEDKKNIEALKQHKRKAVFERAAAAREEQQAALAGEKDRAKSIRAAKKVIEDFEAKEAVRKAKEEQADRDAERHMVSKKEKPAELEATDIDEAGVVNLRDLDMPDPDAFMYRKGKAEKAAHTTEDAEVMVKNIAREWTNAPNVKVKADADLSAAERKWLDDNDAKGFIEKSTGDIVIASDRNADLADVKATLLHEALGHYGLRSKFGEGLSKLMQDIYTTSPKLRAPVDAYMKATKTTDVAKAVEEVLAERQIDGKVAQGALSRVRAWVQNFLREHGIKMAFNEHDLRAILRQASDAVTKGEKREGPLVGETAARKKDKAEKTPRYSDEIPAKARVTLEHEGPDGKVTTKEYRAKEAMREAEQRVSMLEALKRCLS